MLYSETIINHFRQPRNYGPLSNADVSQEEFNPLCGDRIRIELRIDTSTVAEARFVGDGCAISVAAASILTELIVNADMKDVAAITDDLLLTNLKSEISPPRVQCALLPLNALRSGLKNYDEMKKSLADKLRAQR